MPQQNKDKMSIEDIKITQVGIEDLKPSEYNPRMANESECKALKKSIEIFGIVDPIIVNSALNRNNIVVGGHFRLRIAKEMGYKQLPVVYVNIPDVKKEQELNIRLNKQNGSWDYDLLANFDEDMLKDCNFDSKELDKIFQLDTTPEDDDVPEVRTTDIKLGDMFQLGEHVLLCGDCTIEANVERLMGGLKADILYTDPPFGVNVIKGKSGKIGGKGLCEPKEYRAVIGDDKPFEPEFLLTLADKIFIFGANNFADRLPNSPHWLVWDKNHLAIEQDALTFGDGELIWTNIKNRISIKFYRHHWRGLVREGNRKDELTERVHPTQKPVGLTCEILKDYSKNNDIVLDLFLGSGSTLIACEKLNRKCYGMEIDPIYCQVIIDRWEKFTGKKVIKL